MIEGMNFELITLSGVKYQSDAYAVQLPTAAGTITVLKNHEPLMSVLIPGVISIQKSASDPASKWEQYATYGGVVEITGEGARVLVDEADLGEDINEAEVERARAEAEKILASATDKTDIDAAQALLNRQTVKLQVAGLRRRHSGTARQR